MEDIPLFRQIIVQSIEHDDALALVAAAGSVHEARTTIPRTQPEVLLLDLHLPDGSGFKLGLELRRVIPNLRIIVLSEHVRPQILHSLPAEERSHWSYIVKANVGSAEALTRAIRAASAHSIIDPQVRGPIDPIETRLSLLSDSQREILELVAAGYSNAAIARELHMSLKSVERHLSQAYSNLDVLGDADANARVQAAVLFLTHGQDD